MAAALLTLALFVAPSALASPSAVTFTVDTQLDLIDADTSDGTCLPGSCSLRAAIMQANLIPGSEVTIILPSGTYTLTRPPAGVNGADNGDLNLLQPAGGSPGVSIVGAGAASTIINANQIDRVLSVDLLRTATISGVTIRIGLRNGAQGGGISNSGMLTLTDCVIEGNQTNTGGGGIYNLGTLTVLRSTIRLNSAYVGGGIWLNKATTIRNSTLYVNGATSGGGIQVSAYNADPQLTIVNSTISLNFANGNGGGIASEGDVFLYNSSIIDNDADHDRDEYGGIGGGVYENGGGRFVVVNTLIARNTLFDSPIYNDCNGTLEGYGWNLLGELSGCTFTGNGDASRGTIALDTFGSLQNNGGPTFTHALLDGSPAIDSTFAQGCIDETNATLATDQRGKPRPVGTACDVGAFEVQPNMPVANPQTVNAQSGQAKSILLSGSDGDGDPLAYSLVTQPIHGMLSGSAPNLTYTASPDYVGPDSFLFKVNDGTADSPNGKVTINVTAPAVNTMPVANPQSVSTLSGQAKGITLTASDADNNPLTFSVVGQPAHGTLSGSAPNLTYTPTAGFVGTDNFLFKVNDGVVDSTNATVTIQVTATSVNTAPVANPQSVSILSGQAKNIVLTGSDGDGNPLTYSLVTEPAHGALSGNSPNLTYTPTAGFKGNDHFAFKVNDGTADSASAEISIVVEGTGPVVENEIYLPVTKK